MDDEEFNIYLLKQISITNSMNLIDSKRVSCENLGLPF